LFVGLLWHCLIVVFVLFPVGGGSGLCLNSALLFNFLKGAFVTVLRLALRTVKKRNV